MGFPVAKAHLDSNEEEKIMMNQFKKFMTKALCAALVIAACGTAGAEGAIQSDFSAYPDSKDALIACIKTHESETATYTFEAECTDLAGKSGPGWSGETSGTSMAVGILDGKRSEGCVSYLYDAGLTVNFIVVCDRDVDDAVMSFRLGAEHMDLPVNSDAFMVRVDTVAQEDLYPVSADGAIGAWDLAFLGYYPAGSYISTFECPADSVILSKEATGPSNFADYLITSHLQLKEGVNSISLLVNGMPLDPDMDGKTTMRCKAPCIDNMKITTTAQLGFYNQQNNGYGTDGLKVAE